jgi:2-isopropylmalate synthase
VLGEDAPTSAAAIARLTEFSRYVDDVANLTPMNGQPFVGRSAFAHKGGMHAHAMQLDSSSYEHIDPAVVGNSRRVLVSELSGRSNVAALTEQYGITDSEVTKQVLAEIVRRENLGYQYEAAGASFALVVQKAMRTFIPHFKRIRYQVEVSGYGGAKGGYTRQAIDASHMEYEHSEATVKLALPAGRLIHEVAEGNGPVAALDAALRKALEPIYPSMKDLHLVDYKVRVVRLPEEAAKTQLHTMITGTASAIRVIVDSRDRAAGENFSTVGVGTNIIEASWRALVDAVEYKLSRDDAKWSIETREAHHFEASKPATLAGSEPSGAQRAEAW